MAKKAKGNRVQVILECTEHKDSGMPGTSRYITTKLEYTILKHRSQLFPFISESIRFVVCKDTGAFKSVEVTHTATFLLSLIHI